MTPNQVILVKESFRKVGPISNQAAVLFYARLFELDPSLRPLFRGDIAEQGRKLIASLSMTVALLHQIDLLLPQLHDLGARHAEYGVKEQQYATVGEALLWTLEKALGPEFSPAVREAWIATFALIAQCMMEGARAAANAPAPGRTPAMTANR